MAVCTRLCNKMPNIGLSTKVNSAFGEMPVVSPNVSRKAFEMASVSRRYSLCVRPKAFASARILALISRFTLAFVFFFAVVFMPFTPLITLRRCPGEGEFCEPFSCGGLSDNFLHLGGPGWCTATNLDCCTRYYCNECNEDGTGRGQKPVRAFTQLKLGHQPAIRADDLACDEIGL